MTVVLIASPEGGRRPADDRDEGSDPNASETPLERALQNNRRREILRVLCQEGDGTSLSSLATRVTAEDRYLPSVIASLHDLHLPKLAEDGIVDYAPGDGVTLEADRERVERTLRGAADDE